jgi:hypothetical protein
MSPRLFFRTNRQAALHTRRPASAYRSLPPALRAQLDSVSKKSSQVQWTLAACWLAGGFSVLLTLQAGLDWWLDLSQEIRTGFLSFDLTAAAGLLCFFVWRNRRLPVESAALLAERKWADFNSGLISAVQFAREPSELTPLVAELTEQMSLMAARRRLSEAVPTAHLRLPLWIAGSLVLVAILAFVAAWPASPLLLRRIALQNIPFPTRTTVLPVSGSFGLQAGSSATLSARAEGLIPRAGRVEVYYPGKLAILIPLVASTLDPALFSTTLENIQQPFSYRIYLNDGRSPEETVHIIKAPALDSVAFEQFYPAYTNIDPTAMSAGGLDLLAGSTLRITGRANGPLRSAHLSLSGSDKIAPLNLSANTQEFSGTLTIPATELAGFSVVLENNQGVASLNNTLYKIRILPDTPPVITMDPDTTGRRTLVTSSKPVLRFDVSDDFKVSEITLCCQPDDSGDKILRIPLLLPVPMGSVRFDEAIEDPASKLPWKEGNTLTWWIEARDNNDITGPGIARSNAGEWVIISKEAKQREIQERLERSARSLEDLSKKQDELRGEVGNILKKP